MWYTKVSLLFFAKSNYDLSNEWGILAVRQLDSKTPDKCVWIVVYLNLQLLFLYLFIKDHRWCFATSSQSMCAQATLQPSAHADRPGRPNRQVNCPFMNNNKFERNNNINTTLFFAQNRLRSSSPQILRRSARFRLFQSQRRCHHEKRPQLRAVTENPQIYLRFAKSVRRHCRRGSLVRIVRVQLQFGSIQGSPGACGTCIADIARSGAGQSFVSCVSATCKGADFGGDCVGHFAAGR